MFGLNQAAFRIVTIGAIVCLLIVMGLTLAWCDARKDAREARGQRDIAQGQATVGKTAIDIGDRQNATERDLVETERQNREDILNAENAKESAGPAGDAGLRAICGRVSRRDDPACVRLREPNRANATQRR